MKKQYSATFNLIKPQSVSTSEKIVHLLKEYFNLPFSDDVPVNSKTLMQLQKQTNKLAVELGYKNTDSDLNRLDKEHLLTYSLLTLSNSQSAFINQSPDLTEANQYILSSIAKAFGVSIVEDTEALLALIALKFKIDDPHKIGDELAERLLCIPKIIAKFGLDKKDPNLLFDPDNLCEAIRNKCEDTTFLDRVIKLLELPANSTESTVTKLLTKKLSYSDQTEQLNILKRQNNDLRDKVVELKSKSSQGKLVKQDSLYDLELELADKKNADLINKINILKSDVECLAARNKDLEKQVRDPFKTSDSLQKMMKQIDSQSQEIDKLMKSRKQLVLLIRKQSQLLTEYDKRALVQSNSPQQRKLRQVQMPPVDDKIFDIISDAIENAPPDIVDGVLKITKNVKYTRIDKIKKIIFFFIEEIRKQRQSVGAVKVNKGEYERLVTAMHSQLRFLENLVNCDDDVQLLFEEPDEAKKAIQEQVTRIEEFLKQNAKGFVEDATIFDTLQLNVNPLELSKRLQSFFDRFPAIQTPEGDELFVMLRMSLAANGILRRFAITTRNQLEKRQADIRALSARIEKLKYERGIDHNLPPIENEIDNSKTNDREIDDDKERLEKQLIQTRKLLSKAQATIEASRDLPLNDDELHHELQQQIEKQLKEIKQLTTNISSLEDQIDVLNQQLASSQMTSEKLTQELTQVKEKSALKINQLKRELSEKNAEVSENLSMQKSEVMKQTVEKMKQSRQKLKNLVNEKESIIERLNYELEKQKQSNAKMDALLRQAQTKHMSCEYENKMLHKKIEELENKLDGQMLDSDDDASHHDDVESIRAKLKEKHQNFLAQIYTTMDSYFDESSLITDSSVIQMLKNVKAKIKELKAKNSSLLKEITQLRP